MDSYYLNNPYFSTSGTSSILSGLDKLREVQNSSIQFSGILAKTALMDSVTLVKKNKDVQVLNALIEMSKI